MPIRIPRIPISTHSGERRPLISGAEAGRAGRATADMFKALSSAAKERVKIEKRESFRKDENLLRENPPDVILEEKLREELDPNMFNDDGSVNFEGTITKFEDGFDLFGERATSAFESALAEVEGMNFEKPESRDYALSLLKGGIKKFKSEIPMRKAEYGLKLDEYKGDYVDNILSVMEQEEDALGPERNIDLEISELQTLSDTILAEDQKTAALDNIDKFVSDNFNKMLTSPNGALDFLTAALIGHENPTVAGKSQELLPKALGMVSLNLSLGRRFTSNSGNTDFFITSDSTLNKARNVVNLLILKGDTDNAQLVQASIDKAVAQNKIGIRTPVIMDYLGDHGKSTKDAIALATGLDKLDGTDGEVISSQLASQGFFESGWLNDPTKIWKTTQFFLSMNGILPEELAGGLEKFLEKDIHEDPIDKIVFKRLIGLMSRPETRFLESMGDRKEFFSNWKLLTDKGLAVEWAAYKALPVKEVEDLLSRKYNPFPGADEDQQKSLRDLSNDEYEENWKARLIEEAGLEIIDDGRPSYGGEPDIFIRRGVITETAGINTYTVKEHTELEMKKLYASAVDVKYQQIRQANPGMSDISITRQARIEAWNLWSASITPDVTGLPGDTDRIILIHKIGSRDYQVSLQNGIRVSGGRYVTAALEQAVSQAKIPESHLGRPVEYLRKIRDNAVLTRDVLGNYAIFMNDPDDETNSGWVTHKTTGLPLLMNVENIYNFSLSPTYLTSTRDIKELSAGRVAEDTNIFLQKEAIAANLSDIVLGPLDSAEYALSIEDSNAVTSSQIQVIEDFIKYGGMKDVHGIPVMAVGNPFTENAMSEIVGIPGYEDLSDDRKHFILQKAVSSARQRMNEDSFLHNDITLEYFMDEVKTRYESEKAIIEERRRVTDENRGIKWGLGATERPMREVSWSNQDSKDALSAAKTRFWVRVNLLSALEKTNLFNDMRAASVPFRLSGVFVGEHTLDAMAARAITGRTRGGNAWAGDAVKVAQAIERVFKERKNRPLLLESLNISGRESEVPPEFYDLYGAPHTNDPKAYSADNLMARGQKEDLTGEPWNELRVIYSTLGSKPTAKKVTESIYSLTEGWSDPIDYYDYVRFELATKFADPEARIILAMSDKMFAKFLDEALHKPTPWGWEQNERD